MVCATLFLCYLLLSGRRKFSHSRCIQSKRPTEHVRNNGCMQGIWSQQFSPTELFVMQVGGSTCFVDYPFSHFVHFAPANARDPSPHVCPKLLSHFCPFVAPPFPGRHSFCLDRARCQFCRLQIWLKSVLLIFPFRNPQNTCASPTLWRPELCIEEPLPDSVLCFAVSSFHSPDLELRAC